MCKAWEPTLDDTTADKIQEAIPVFQSPADAFWNPFTNDEREVLYERTDSRVNQMIAQGLVAEVEQLKAKGYSPELPAVNTFGYREVYQVLAGEISQEDAVAQIKIGTRHYAKRQLTWFRRNNRITWVENSAGRAAQTILKSLDTNRDSG